MQSGALGRKDAKEIAALLSRACKLGDREACAVADGTKKK
jgi:hypothetical protein